MLSFIKKNVSAIRALPSSSLRARFGSGMVFSLIAAVFNYGSTLLVNIFVANLLGRVIFGEYAMIQSTLLMLSVVGALGTGITTTKFVAEFRSVDKAKTGRVLGLCSALALGMGSLVTLALILSASWLAPVALKAPQLTPALVLSALVVFFNINNYYQTGALVGLEGFRALAWAGMIAGIAYTILCVGGAMIGGRNGAATGLALSAGVQWLALRYHLRRECVRQGVVPNYTGLAVEQKIVLGFALPAALSGLSYSPALWFANAFLARQPAGYAQVALYTAATNFRVVVLFLPQLLNNVAMPLLNNAKGLGENNRFWRVFWGNLGVMIAVTLAGAIVMGLLGPLVLSLFGRSFRDGYVVLLVLLGSTLVESLMQAFYQLIQSEGRMWLSWLAVALPRDATIVISAFWLTAVSGALGLAQAYLLGMMVALVSTLVIGSLLGRSMKWGGLDAAK